MNRRRTLFCLLVLVAAVGVFAAHRASALIALQTPIVTTTGNVRVLSLNCQFPNEVVPASCFITYASTDSSGNVLPALIPQQAGPLTPTDVVAFFSASGGFRQRTQAALQSNQAALAGDAN